jgi:hypothetical protein
MDYNYYALLVSENDRAGEKLVWKAPEKTKYGRQYFFWRFGDIAMYLCLCAKCLFRSEKSERRF